MQTLASQVQVIDDMINQGVDALLRCSDRPGRNRSFPVRTQWTKVSLL